MYRRTLKLISWSALAGMVVTPLFALVLMGLPMEHHGGDCLFMPGETSICAMSVLGHLENWHSTFTTLVVELLIIAAAILVRTWVWTMRSDRPPGYRCRHYPVPPLIQELFSRGILNPKAP